MVRSATTVSCSAPPLAAKSAKHHGFSLRSGNQVEKAALAIQLCRNTDRVALWDHRPERAEKMQRERQNARYVPGVVLPENLWATGDLAAALQSASLVVEVIPSQAVRAVMTDAAPLLPPS